MTLAKPMIPNVRLHDGVKPMTFSDVGRKHAADAAITFSDSGAIDAFGRLRTSSPFTVFDSKQLFD